MAPENEKKKMEKPTNPKLTFAKRTKNVFKKAKELSILCDAETAVILYSNTGKVYEFASSSMDKILARYKVCLERHKKSLELDEMPEVKQTQVTKEVDVVRESKEKFNLSRMLNKDLKAMNLQELKEFQQSLKEGLISLKEKKEKLLLEEIEQSQMKSKQIAGENEYLRRKVEELRGLCPSTSQPYPQPQQLCIGYPYEDPSFDGQTDEESNISLELRL